MEGIIKFTCDWTKQEPDLIADRDLQKLNYWRSELIKMNLIGVSGNGIGFGNISWRLDSSCFVITGSQTGHLETLTKDDLSLVSEYRIEDNYLKCSGKTRASSESLSHAAFYQSSHDIHSVIHIHNRELWLKNLNRLPTSGRSAEYGTPELAKSLTAVISSADYNISTPIIMGGHPEGIIAGGFSLDEAGKNIIRFYNTQRSNNDNR